MRMMLCTMVRKAILLGSRDYFVLSQKRDIRLSCFNSFDCGRACALRLLDSTNYQCNLSS